MNRCLANLFKGKIVKLSICKIVPECFTGSFRDRSNIHDHRTRTSGDIEVPRLVSSRTAFSIIYRGAKLWNKLVPSIKELPINQFKAVLRVGFLGRYTFEID